MPNFSEKRVLVMSRNHKYFERNPETWNSIDFLNECEVEPYGAKIDKYTKTLKAIANNQQGERAKKALDSFILASKNSLNRDVNGGLLGCRSFKAVS
jgi:hypothetical protein